MFNRFIAGTNLETLLEKRKKYGFKMICDIDDYWSEYISEIADKDSKILSCFVHLTPLDIAQLDFSKAIMIDGIRFRLNKIEDFDYTNNELVKVELLKIINNG